MKELDWKCCVMMEGKASRFYGCSPQQAAQCSMALAEQDSSSAPELSPEGSDSSCVFLP